MGSDVAYLREIDGQLREFRQARQIPVLSYMNILIATNSAVERQNLVSRIFTKIDLSSLPSLLDQSSTYRVQIFSGVQLFDIATL